MTHASMSLALCLVVAAAACSDDGASIDWSVARKHSQLVMDSLHTATAERFFDTAYFPAEKTREILSTMNSNCDPASRTGRYVTSEDGAQTASPGTMDFIYDYEYTCARARFRLKYIPTSTGDFKLVSFGITDLRDTGIDSPR